MTERDLRSAFNEWPRMAPVELLSELDAFELEIAPNVRGATNWAAVIPIVERRIGELMTRFPSFKADLEARRMDWLSRAYEETGRFEEAAECLSRRLRSRRLGSNWRALHYARLVDCLTQLGRIEEALAYARHGHRWALREDVAMAGPIEERVIALSAAAAKSPAK